MRLRRPDAVRCLAVVAVTLVATTALALAAPKLWECNWCHQQYQGNSPPAFAKCPAKDMKQNHWWVQKH